ncbi:hypothetical protein PTKIN_Ptkin03bG0128800 [Pterospermum kingtungense]
MEGHMNKRRRIYSLEPRKTMQASSARKYVNYLVPALTKISKEISLSDQCFDHEKEKIVRYEVDMALALSVQGFAWSHALRHNLQLNVNNNVGKFKTSLTQDQLPASIKISSSTTYAPNHSNMKENEAGDNQNAMKLKTVSSNSISNLNHESTTKKPKRAQGTEMEPGTVKEEGIESEEEDECTKLLTFLRNVLPGGKEMMVDDETLLYEVASYISCLELQVNILRSMVETN